MNWNDKISGFDVTETGGLHEQLHDDIRYYIESRDLNTVMVSPTNVLQLIDDCEMPPIEALAQALLDAVYGDYLESLECEPSGAGAISISPILV